MIGSYTAIEQRDNEYHLVKIKPDGTLEDCGTIQNKSDLLSRHIELSTSEGYRSSWSDLYITFIFTQKIKDLEIAGKTPYDFLHDPLKVEGTMTLNEFISYMKMRPIIQMLKEDVRKSIIVEKDAPEPFYGVEGVYILAGSDVKDYRTRRIDLEKLKVAMKKIDNFYMDEQKGKEAKMSYLFYLTGYAYDVELEEGDKQLVDILYSAIISDDEQCSRSMLADYEGIMNNKRKEIQDSKQELLVFKDEQVKQEYYSKKAEYEQAKEENEQKQQNEYNEKMKKIAEHINETENQARFESIKKTAYYSIIADEEYEKNGKYADPNAFPGLPHLLMPGSSLRFTRPGDRKIEIEKFREDMQFAIEKMKVGEAERFVRDRAKATIDSAYQLFTREEQTEHDIEEDYQYMIKALYEYGINGTQIDEEKFESANKRLNEKRQKGHETISKNSAVLIEPQIETAYEYLCKLSEKLSQKDIIEASKMIVHIHERSIGRNESEVDR